MKKSANGQKESNLEAHSTPRTVDAMPIMIKYLATWAEYSVQKSGEDFVFTFSNEVDGEPDWNEKYLNAYEVRDEFERVSNPTEALDFLTRNGPFLPHGFGTFTWSEFQRWKELANLVRERKALVDAMKKGKRTGKEAEAIKAIGGIHDSTFFEGAQAEEDRELRSWFHRPPSRAISIELKPRIVTAQLLRSIRSGVMIEYLCPRDELEPVLLIEATAIIQAIAATLYADRMAGVTIKRCPEPCNRLFEVKDRPWQKYHDERCKELNKQRRLRAKLKAAKLKAPRRKAKKPKQA